MPKKHELAGDFVIDEDCSGGEEMDEVVDDGKSGKSNRTTPGTFKKRDKVEKMLREQLAKSISDYDFLIDDAGREMKEIERSIKKTIKCGNMDKITELLKIKAGLRSSRRMLMTSKERVLLELVKHFDLMGSLDRKNDDNVDSAFNVTIESRFAHELDCDIIDPKPQEAVIRSDGY